MILARQITQRNVVRIFDLGEASGIKFITMEYVEGQDLHSLLRQHNTSAPKEEFLGRLRVQADQAAGNSRD